MKSWIRYNITIIKYHLRLLTRKLAVPFLPSSSAKDLSSLPEVTIFISSFNTRYPLELTIKSLLKHTSYPKLRLWIAENASTDGSSDYVNSLKLAHIPLRILKTLTPKLHSEWLDEVAANVDTPYWMSVHPDMIFYSGDWVVDMISVMEKNLNQDLVIAEPVSSGEIGIEPISGKTVKSYEKLSTWLLCFRTNYREKIQTSFSFVKETEDPNTGIIPIYDTGEKLLADMKDKKIQYGYMPTWFQKRYYHFGSLSYAFTLNTNKNYQDFKLYQIQSIRRMITQIGDIPELLVEKSKSYFNK